MIRLTVRILLLLAVIAVGRIALGGFGATREPTDVIVVLMPGANCTSDAPVPDNIGVN